MKSSVVLSVAAALAALGILAGGWWIYTQSFAGVAPAVEQAAADWRLVPGEPHPVSIRTTPATPRVATGEVTYHGTPVTVSCSTCHTTRTPDPRKNRAEDLDTFHQGMTFAHGQLACLSCHQADDYDQLRLANGLDLPFAQTMRLCAQCHGPQYRDYEHGSHGGMTGYWDLQAGPRERNHCLACHDAHAPAYQPVRPVFFPRDLAPASAGPDGHGH